MRVVAVLLFCMVVASCGCHVLILQGGADEKRQISQRICDAVPNFQSLAEFAKSQPNARARIATVLKALALLVFASNPADGKQASGAAHNRQVVEKSKPPKSTSVDSRDRLKVDKGSTKGDQSNIEDAEAVFNDMLNDTAAAVVDTKLLIPFQQGRPEIVIGRAVREVLDDGEVWQKIQTVENSAIGQAVMDVDASPDVVWKHLLDFDSYPKKVPRLAASKVYHRADEGGQVEHIYVRFMYSTLVGRVTYHLEHIHDQELKSIIWTLDEEMKNDIEEDQGHWYVEPHPDDPSKARVFLEIGLVTPRWVPQAMIRQYAKRAITDATMWVRRMSELEASGGESAVAQAAGAEGLLRRRLFSSWRSAEGDARHRQIALVDGRDVAEEVADEDQISNHSSFEQGRPAFEVDKQGQKMLAKGERWSSIQVDGHSSSGQAVMDVAASPSDVWNQLLDFVSYSEKARAFRSSEVYKVVGDKSERTFVKFVNPVLPGVKLTYHVDHIYEPSENSMVFSLDGDKKNDFEDVQGHWYVEPCPYDASKTRVFYELSLVIPRWVPQRVIDKVAQKAMLGSLSWVRRESEQQHALRVAKKQEKEKKLVPFQRGRPLSVYETVERFLARGHVYQSFQIIEGTVTGQIIMDVKASPRMVWNQLFDFLSYPRKVPYIRHAEVYKRILNGTSSEQIFVKFIHSFSSPVLKLHSHIVFTYEPEKGSITWEVDGSRKNQFGEDQGHWHIEQHPDSPSKSRVYFEMEVVLPHWLPESLIVGIAQSTIRSTAAWVKRESEREAAKGPAALMPPYLGSLLHVMNEEGGKDLIPPNLRR